MRYLNRDNVKGRTGQWSQEPSERQQNLEPILPTGANCLGSRRARLPIGPTSPRRRSAVWRTDIQSEPTPCSPWPERSASSIGFSLASTPGTAISDASGHKSPSLSESVNVVAELDVHLDRSGIPSLIGMAWFTQRRSNPVSTVFAYSVGYLAQPGAFPIDPELPLVSGNQYTDGLPGAFEDCSPDRWGRNLIKKRRRSVDYPGSERPGDLNSVDYLVGVSDLTRQGALRFTHPGQPAFLAPDTDVPKLVDLPRLLNASDALSNDSNDWAATKVLLEAGSGSLGGARPKASVRDDNRLLIAKFPHPHDDWDVMAWECVALDLARLAGLDVPNHRLVDLGNDRRILLTQRFDRTDGDQRLPYMSAMTLISGSDGGSYDYLDVADHLADASAGASDDLADLYRRVVFSVAIHNTDDHLRNLGLLHHPGGWRLAPVFDVNPNPAAHSTRVTAVAGAIGRGDEPAALIELANRCRLSADAAQAIHAEVHQAAAVWRDTARRLRISEAEIRRFEAAFSGVG